MTTTPSFQAGQKGGPRPSVFTRLESGLLVGVATVLFVIATAIMLYDSSVRMLFDESHFWAEEAVRYLMVWAFLLSISAAGSGGYHLRTELLVDRLPFSVQKVLNILAGFAGMLFSGALLWSSIPQLERYYTMGMVTESDLDMKVWILFLAMPIGAALLFTYYVRVLLRAFRLTNPFASFDAPDEPSK